MAATLTFVTGRSGAGKSRLLYGRVAELLQTGRPLLIVPEQFTFEAERALSEALGGGLMGVEVYSFTSLSARVLEEAGERTAFLSAQGRRMVIRRAIEECRGDLLSFGGVCDRPGFCAQCDALFSLCKRSLLTPEALRAAIPHLDDDPLARKLADLARLYGACEASLDGKYMGDTDALTAMLGHIPASFLTGADVLIDNCDFWAEQIYGVVRSLMQVCRTLTLCVRADFSPDCRDRAVFRTEYRAYERLSAMAREAGCAIRQIDLAGADSRYTAPALAHWEREAFAYPFRVYEGAPDGLCLYAAADVASEAAAAADAVQRAAQSGLRYRDMAVVACDLPRYVTALRRAFRARGIPCFTDARHPLARHALPRLLGAALRILTEGCRAADVLTLCKTGLCGVDREDAEELENYLLRFGIRGNAFFAPFTRGDVPAGAEAARAALCAPLLALREALRAAPDAMGKTEAVYNYMETLGVRAAMVNDYEELREAGQLELMEENRQVYDAVMELFSQLHAILGPARISNRRFLSLLEEGIAAYEIGAVPSTADQVLLGSLDRTKARSVKALFLLGAVEGALPQSVHDDGVIDDRELARMQDTGLNIWDDSETHAAVARMDAYLAVTKPSALFYLSFRRGEDAVPAALVDRMREIFPALPVLSDLTPLDPPDAAGGFARLAGALRTGVTGGAQPPDGLYAYYKSDPAYAPRVAMLERALRPAPTAPLGETAQALFGGSGSVTRLESFNACPFRHYARYGLKAQPRTEYRERRLDEGVFCHEALALFARELQKRALDPAALTRADVCALLQTLLPPLLATHNNGILTDTPRTRAAGARLIRRVETTAYAVVRQLAAGEFRIEGSEVTFGDKGRFPALRLDCGGRTYVLSGKIDRLDGFSDADAHYYRIIDYKSGDASFDYASLYHGLRMQLPLYIAAATAADGIAAGMYYLPIDDPVLEEGELETALIKKFRLQGITLSDARVEQASDAEATVISSRGRVTADVMARVLRYAREKSEKSAAAMLDGEIAPRPVLRTGKPSACAYCDYGSVCRFEAGLPHCAYAKVASMDAENFMERTES